MVPLLVESETDKVMNWQLASAEPLVHWVNADEVTQTLKSQEITSQCRQEYIEANYRFLLFLYLPSE